MSSQTCPNCGWLNRATNRFCSNCGAAIAPAAPAPGDAVSDATPSLPTRVVSDTSSTVTPPAAGPSDTQPVTYAVKRWDASSDISTSSTEAGQPFTPPAPKVDPSAPTIPIAPPPVPPTSYPYPASEPRTPPFGNQVDASTMALPQRGDGGTYVPYSNEAARQLEAKKGNQSWLIPSVIVGALLLLIVGSVGGFLLLNGQKAGTVTKADPTPTIPLASVQLPSPCGDLIAGLDPKGSGEQKEDVLKGIICQSNQEQIKAWRELDTEILSGTRTGQALDENIQAVQELRNKGMYAIPDNKSIEFGTVNFSGDTAIARTVEVWTVTFYNKSDKTTIQSQGPDTLREVYHFVKVDGNWKISSVDIVSADPSKTPGTDDTQ